MNVCRRHYALTRLWPRVLTEIVVIGTGETLDKPVSKDAIESLTSKGIVVEQMDTVSLAAALRSTAHM